VKTVNIVNNFTKITLGKQGKKENNILKDEPCY